ncbi:MAG: nicotinate (nicotinamide) nucleotide adenylyltransferase [Massiliimalia sp.]|jgi:nicotinate-nucleotide adenylyltransferase
MEQVAIFGGTFNPIHKGHIHLCRQCQKAMGFDRVILMPTNIPPHKRAHHLASNEDRLQMCTLAVKGNPDFSVSDLEMRRQGVSYTVDTLGQIHQEHPDWKLFLLIGSDMLFMFHRWYQWETILSLADLVVGAREPEEEQRMRQYAAQSLQGSEKIHILKLDAMPMSSTVIRRMLRNGEDPAEYLEPEVYEYINAHHLYRSHGKA